MPKPQMKVMLVDDHEGFRNIVRTMLSAAAPDILECGDGVQAAAYYARFRPDLVLMDIGLSGRDGILATAEITARFPEARVYMLTQYDDPGLREAARRAGACGYLLKDDLSQVQALLNLPVRIDAPKHGCRQGGLSS